MVLTISETVNPQVNKNPSNFGLYILSISKTYRQENKDKIGKTIELKRSGALIIKDVRDYRFLAVAIDFKSMLTKFTLR